MSQLPTATTLSLDDGAPYYPTITEISESPLKPGLLYVGTDDGNVQVSQDDGKHWANLGKRFPGLPEQMWVSGIEASRHDAGTVYVSFDGHRSNDFANYLYRSTDFGNRWTSIAAAMPPGRVIHAVHEDPKNPALLYAATEQGLYVSPDAGAHWIEFRNNMPRVPINDLVIHPRDNDLILASHGRGVWILDDISPLQQLTPQVLGEPAHLFAPRAVEEIRYFSPRAHQGDLTYHGDNPPPGALIDFYLQAAGATALRVIDAAGTTVATMTPPGTAGLNRVVWRPRHPALPPGPPDEESGGRAAAIPGPFVLPGEYTVRLTVVERSYEQKLRVLQDPRIQIPEADRRQWTDSLLAIAETYRGAVSLLDGIGRGGRESGDLQSVARELQSRLATLYRDLSRSTARPTADQQAQAQFFETELRSLRARVAR
jgi:hypothetical protein